MAFSIVKEGPPAPVGPWGPQKYPIFQREPKEPKQPKVKAPAPDARPKRVV